MIVEKVFIKNFMSIEEATISYSGGLVLVEGVNKDDSSSDSNGSGKSVLLVESLVWGLWGKTVRGIGYDKVVNRWVGKNCLVKIYLSVGKDKYIIIRYRKHKKYHNIVRVFCNGRDLTKIEVSETQEYINEIIGYDFEIFVRSILFAQEDIKDFALMTDVELKDLFDKILGLSIFN